MTNFCARHFEVLCHKMSFLFASQLTRFHSHHRFYLCVLHRISYTVDILVFFSLLAIVSHFDNTLTEKSFHVKIEELLLL